jgi:predicted HicB family RNase H-like nuclease
MNVMTCESHSARIGFDAHDNIFVGRILGICSIIRFDGATVDQLRTEFEHAIDGCLADCAGGG